MTRDGKSGDGSNRKVSGRWGIGFALGIAIGIALGIAMDNLGAGIAIGGGVGVALAISLDEEGKRRRKRGAEREDPDS
ncbi:MAG: hypothetical protein Q4P23_15335 [Micrococcaceae bacterium]|nr:hypothetical protein [Micrococcaceae bacterium]